MKFKFILMVCLFITTFEATALNSQLKAGYDLESVRNLTSIIFSDFKRHRGDTALHVFARHGLTKRLRRYLMFIDKEYCTIINAANHRRNTPLIEAVKNDQRDCATLLIEHGADTSLLDEKEYSALAHALAQNNLPLVEELVAHHAIVTSKILSQINQITNSHRRDKILEILLSNGAFPTHVGNFSPRLPPCCMAAYLNLPNLLEGLIQCGTNVDEQSQNDDSQGSTALMFACQKGFSECVVVLKNHASPLIENERRKTAFFFTCVEAKGCNYLNCVERSGTDAPKICGILADMVVKDIKEVEHEDYQLQTLRGFATMTGAVKAVALMDAHGFSHCADRVRKELPRLEKAIDDHYNRIKLSLSQACSKSVGE